MDDKVLKYIEEINRMQDEINLHLACEYQSFIDHMVSAKQAMVLEIIRMGEASTTSELAAKLQITSSAVSQLLNKLEKNGYIKRTINPNNRREILIELDETSIAYFEQLAQIEQSITEKYYAKLGMKDIQDLHRILHKLKNIIKESE